MILKILGKSPSDIGLLTAVVVGLVLNEIKTAYTDGKFQEEMREFKRNVGESFIRVRDDIKELKTDVREIKDFVKK